MIDLNTEMKTVHAFLYAVMKTSRLSRTDACSPYQEKLCFACLIFSLLGKDQGLTEEAALKWGQENVQLHIPTLGTLRELSDDLFGEMTPELRRAALLDAMTQLSHKLYLEDANMSMDTP
jgi:hypothetical protein